LNGDSSKWLASIVLTVFLLALAVPSRYLFSAEEWEISFRLHPWVDYLEAPLYLAGILLAMLAFGLLGAALLRLAAGAPLIERPLRFIVGSGALFGLSPLQPVFATVVLMLLLPTLVETEWIGPGAARWVFTVALVALFGLALGTELALRITPADARSPRGWIRCAGSVLTEQAPALAGRMAVVLMAGPLLMTATSGLVDVPGAALPTDVPRLALPNEGLIVALLSALLAFGLWRGARRMATPVATSAQPAPWRSLLWQVTAWALVAIALLTPLLAVDATGDPLRFDVTRRLEPPSSDYPFGTDQLGRDQAARLAYAWRDTIYAGLLVGFAVAGLGLLWRGLARLSRILDDLERILWRVPPAIAFFAAWGVTVGRVEEFPSLRSVSVACGVVLIPVSLRLLRRVEARAAPAAIGTLVLLANLLVVGWSTVVGQLGLLAPPFPSFGGILLDARPWQLEASWTINYTVLVLTAAVLLPLLALGALQRAFDLPRHLIRLRG
jgi:ABC-type dipeptide/oligopeptide/nickel transport system permease subunit